MLIAITKDQAGSSHIEQRSFHLFDGILLIKALVWDKHTRELVRDLISMPYSDTPWTKERIKTALEAEAL